MERLPGGYAAKLGWPPEQYDQEQLAVGVQVELEHVDDPRIALEIAADHLAEQVLQGRPQDYYTRLAQMESPFGQLDMNTTVAYGAPFPSRVIGPCPYRPPPLGLTDEEQARNARNALITFAIFAAVVIPAGIWVLVSERREARR